MTLWTEEQDEALRDLHDTASFNLLAAALNERFGTSFSRCAVIGRAHRLGLKNKTVPPVSRPLGPKKDTAPQARDRLTQAISCGGSATRVQAINRGPASKGDGYKPKSVPVASLDVRLVDLEPTQCRFACNRVDDEWRFCALPVTDGGSWCPDHHALVWNPRVAPAKQKPHYRDEKRRAA